MVMAVSSSGASVQTASGPSSLLNLNYPMSKLDTTNIVSFQTISILFSHEPPQPTFSTPVTDTQLYQFAHGYSYIPTCWMIWQNPSPAYPAAPGSGGTATTFPAFGDETPILSSATQLALLANVAYNDPSFGSGNYSTAYLYFIADVTNVTIYVRKTSLQPTSSNTAVPVFLAGTTVNIRLDCFVEPGTTSTY